MLALRPVTSTPLSSIARVSLSCSWYITVPPTATLPALPPACPRSMLKIASSAFMLKPPSSPLKTSAPCSTVACVVLSSSMMKRAAPTPPFLPELATGSSPPSLGSNFGLSGSSEPTVGSSRLKTPVMLISSM